MRIAVILCAAQTLARVSTEMRALLISTSQGFFNMRHFGDIAGFHAVLKRTLPSHSIVLVTADSPAADPRVLEPLPPALCAAKTALLKQPITAHALLHALAFAHPALPRPAPALVIYLSGHGHSGFMKICDRDFLFRTDLMAALRRGAGRATRVLLILDTCNAASLVTASELPSNVAVVATSMAQEPSYSLPRSPLHGVSLMDTFITLFERLFPLYDPNTPLPAFFAAFTSEELHSSLSYFGNPDFMLKDFFY